MYNIGIDFGNSCIAAGIYKDGQSELVQFHDSHSIANNPYVLPVSAWADSNHIKVGYMAENEKFKDPVRYRCNFKQYLGSQIPFTVGNRQISAQTLCKTLIYQVYESIKEEYGADVDQVVFTYSNVATLRNRKLFEKAVQLSGIKNVSFLSDAQAAVQYECFQHTHYVGDRFLICDIGGTTIQISLLILTKQGFVDLTTPFHVTGCAGSSFTGKIYDDIVHKNPSVYQRLIQRNKVDQLMKLEQIAEKAKLYLDQHEVYEIEETLEHLVLSYRVTRAEYNKMIASTIDIVMKGITYLLQNTMLKEEDISSVVFVGGSTKTYSLLDRMSTFLHKALPEIRFPELSACMGAALVESVKTQEEVITKIREGIQLAEDSIITFGSYQQEPILWHVIEQREEAWTCVSERVICFKAYTVMNADQDCEPTLLKWLNSSDKSVHYSYPPNSNSVLFNSYDHESGFLSNFSEIEQKLLYAGDNVSLPNVSIIAKMNSSIAYPTLSSVVKNEGTFGEDYSIDRPCPYWSTGELNCMDANGNLGIEITYNGTIGVRPVIRIKEEVYITKGEGTLIQPYHIIG